MAPGQMDVNEKSNFGGAKDPVTFRLRTIRLVRGAHWTTFHLTARRNRAVGVTNPLGQVIQRTGDSSGLFLVSLARTSSLIPFGIWARAVSRVAAFRKVVRRCRWPWFSLVAFGA